MYIGGIDRYFIFWAYSSDGTFGGNTETILKRKEYGKKSNVQPLGNCHYLYDLQGKRLSRSLNGSLKRSLLIMKNGNTGQVRKGIWIKKRK